MDRVVTTRQAAEQLGVSLRTVQLWVESGVLKAWKTAGGHRRIAEQSVQALIADQRQALTMPSNSAQLRVLIVEDETQLLQLYRLTIESWQLPVKIDTSTNGFEGLIHLGRCTPDILITDLIMPHMDGLEMIRMLRSNPEYSNIGIMVVTTLTADEIDTRGGLPTDVQVFPKPIPFGAIQAILQQRIEVHAPASQQHDYPAASE